jgi:alanine racemase
VYSNGRLLKTHIGEKVHLMTVIKADAYGYGMLEIAQTALSADATWLGVATFDEALVSIVPNLHCSGVYTHFATTEDVHNTSYFRRPLTRFHEFLEVVPNRTEKLIHCANSGATMYHAEKPFFDMVRFGKALLGPPNESLIFPVFLPNV